MLAYIYAHNYMQSASFIADLSTTAVRGMLPLMEAFCAINLRFSGE
jgi:hypothetical protein